MATFDANRLDTGQYTPAIPSDAVRIQNTIEDFMHLVRTNPAYVAANTHLLNQFGRLIDDDKTFPLARRVVPELRYPQDYDTSENTLINIILRAPGIKRGRPPPALADPTNAAERELIRRQTRAMLMYLEYDRGREETATQEQREDSDDVIDRSVDAILPESR